MDCVGAGHYQRVCLLHSKIVPGALLQLLDDVVDDVDDRVEDS
jgi:hypothetical protein